MFRGQLKLRHLLQCMVLSKLLLNLTCIKFVAGDESPNLPIISFDLTIPLNKVLSGNISKSDFKSTLVSTILHKNNTGSKETIGLLYAAGTNALTNHNIYLVRLDRNSYHKQKLINCIGITLLTSDYNVTNAKACTMQINGAVRILKETLQDNFSQIHLMVFLS